MSIVIRKGESCALALVFVIRLHGILKAACFPYNGNRAVAQSHQLAQAAWFKQGRHEERIAGSVYLMGHSL